jgi:hypothetical protein
MALASLTRHMVPVHGLSPLRGLVRGGRRVEASILRSESDEVRVTPLIRE